MQISDKHSNAETIYLFEWDITSIYWLFNINLLFLTIELDIHAVHPRHNHQSFSQGYLNSFWLCLGKMIDDSKRYRVLGSYSVIKCL